MSSTCLINIDKLSVAAILQSDHLTLPCGIGVVDVIRRSTGLVMIFRHLVIVLTLSTSSTFPKTFGTLTATPASVSIPVVVKLFGLRGPLAPLILILRLHVLRRSEGASSSTLWRGVVSDRDRIQSFKLLRRG